MRPCRCLSPTTVGSSFERMCTDCGAVLQKQENPFSKRLQAGSVWTRSHAPQIPPLPRMLLMDLAAPFPTSTASSASSSGISSTGIFVVVSPRFTGPCSAVLGARWPHGFLAGGWRAVIPLGTACLSVCLSVPAVF